jgi:hypothetical protein
VKNNPVVINIWGDSEKFVVRAEDLFETRKK